MLQRVTDFTTTCITGASDSTIFLWLQFKSCTTVKVYVKLKYCNKYCCLYFKLYKYS